MTKKLAYLIILMCVATSACTDINQESPAPVKSGLISVTMTAEMETAYTKAGFSIKDYPCIEWKAGDAISVIGEKTGNQKFTSGASGLIATFKGKADPTDNVLHAIYPYSENYRSDLSDIIIPSIQKAVAGTFDPKAYIAVAESPDKNFSFKALGAFYKFSLTDATNVSSVKFTANQGDKKVILSGTDSQHVTLIRDKNQFMANSSYFVITNPEQCPYGLNVMITYDDGRVYNRNIEGQIFETDARNCIKDFGILDQGGEWMTVLEQVLDFSYAGFKHGEEAPADAFSLGYKVFDITDYGAIPSDGKSDREALIKALKAALGSSVKEDGNGWLIFPANAQANAIIYFPEGEYVLYSAQDDKDSSDGKSPSIVIPAGNFIIKGAGRDKTVLIMTDPMEPKTPDQMYSSPDMIQIKHNNDMSDLTWVTGMGAKGGFSLEVQNTGAISPGSWVCLHVLNNDEEFVNQEIAPYNKEDGTFSYGGKPTTWTIITNGVEIYDYHQVKSVEGNIVTFYEPMMHEVNPKYGWVVKSFPHYENIGVEDLTFKGNAPSEYKHHGDWIYDGGYKPLSMMRVTDSWVRRVGFESTSECLTITGSANVSVYDAIMKGRNGHSAIRSQASSRVLIAGTMDLTEGGGNFHAIGVSKHSIGTVLYRNTWGEDSCFESHANQPRATLIDCCRGGWHMGHMGGNAYEAPHHLADLTVWNFYATKGSGEFGWWDTGSWRFLPPIIVGFQSAEGMTFKQDEVTCDIMHGKVPTPESLYELQLEQRLGAVPTWINELKNIY